MYKVKVYGAKQYWTQVPRLIQGFIGNDCTVSADNDYDFVYSNNFDFAEVDEEHGDSALSNSGFKIFNVLDIPEHIQNFPTQKLKEQLNEADIITCISPPVKEQLKRILNIDATVIWNPIKDVFFDPSQERKINCLYVGRAADPVKRAYLLSKIPDQCCSIGPIGGFGNYLGLVNDISLNQIYNSSKIVLLPSKFEGLGLTALEAMVCGAIPLVCADNPNSALCPDFCICDPTQEAVAEKYQELLNNFVDYQQIILKKYSSQVQRQFSKFFVAKNILDLYNAEHEGDIHRI